jgi:hypothetical protein
MPAEQRAPVMGVRRIHSLLRLLYKGVQCLRHSLRGGTAQSSSLVIAVIVVKSHHRGQFIHIKKRAAYRARSYKLC